MPRRNSPNDIRDLSDLSRLGEIVVDKRRGQRTAAKKNRRNRHYEKQFIRNTLAHRPLIDSSERQRARRSSPSDFGHPVWSTRLKQGVITPSL